MKILWIKSDLLHPTTKGGHIRTLETLRWLHRWHEVHYVAFAADLAGEGVQRSSEYCSRVYPVRHEAPSRQSAAFAAQLVKGCFSSLPVAVFRYQSAEMAALIADLRRREKFDVVVCDFIVPAVNLDDLGSCVVFQHNVETMIWRRHAQNSRNIFERTYLRQQERRMLRFEEQVCRAARHVIAVSAEDAAMMREMFGISRVSAVPTGVDVDYFRPPVPASERSGLVFVGSMDWLPNIDGMRYFCEEVLPLIRRRSPQCPVTIVGRQPTRVIQAMAEADPLIRVTGTVADVRPYLWSAAVSIVPLRIGGGTRMKIYEAMAAGAAVVSTTIGAEGLEIHPPDDILISDTPTGFADNCLALLESSEKRQQQAAVAREMVASRFGWEQVARQFESILLSTVSSGGHRPR